MVRQMRCQVALRRPGLVAGVGGKNADFADWAGNTRGFGLATTTPMVRALKPDTGDPKFNGCSQDASS
jgi:hypothetical protein